MRSGTPRPILHGEGPDERLRIALLGVVVLVVIVVVLATESGTTRSPRGPATPPMLLANPSSPLGFPTSPPVQGVLGAVVENLRGSLDDRAYAVDSRDRSAHPCTLTADGALIDVAQPGGAAAEAGLVGGRRHEESYINGDIIVSVDGKPTPDARALSSELAPFHPGETVKLGVQPCHGPRRTVPVQLGVTTSR